MTAPTTTIGYAALQIIPSLDGLSESVDKQLGGTLLVAGKKGGKQLAKGVGEGLKDLEREVESAANAYQKLKDKADDALGKVRVEEEKLKKARAGGKEDQIAAAEERRAKALRDSARAAKDAEAGDRKLQDAQRRLGDGSKDTGGRLDSLGVSMRSMGALAGGAALAGVAALGTGLVVAGKQVYELGSAFDDLSDTLQVKTGLSGRALDDLSASVQKLGTTNTPSSLGEIGDVAAEVTRNLHLTGEPLEALTSRLANLDRLGQSVDVRNLGKAFRGFGVDVADQVPSLNALYEASTQSGLSIDDIVASVVKGGPALRELGLSFGESAALASALEDAGLDVDKMISGGLTKSLATLAKDGQSGQDALTGTIDEVKRLIDVGDDAGAQDLTNKLFGAKGGLQFFEAIRSGALDLQSLSASLGQTGLDINDVSDDTADWAEEWQTLKNQVSVALAPAAGTFFDTINGKLGELSTWVTTHEDEVIDFFVDLGEGAISAAEVGTTALAGLVDAFHLFDTLVMNSLSWLPGYDDEKAKEFNDALGDLSEKLNSAADSGLWDELRTGLKGAGEDAKSGNDGLSLFGDSVSGAGDRADTAAGQVAGLNEALKENANLPLFGGAGAGLNTGPAGVGQPLFGGAGGGTGPGGVWGALGSFKSGFDWDAVAAQESSGRWDDNNSGGHTTSSGAPRGGLQITDGTWSAYGGQEFAPTAAGATKEEQIAVAERIAFSGYNGAEPQGLGAWEVITQGKVPGVTASTPRPSGGGASIPPDLSGAGQVSGVTEATPGIQQLAAIIAERFPGVNLGGVRPSDGPNTPTGHQRGVALDIGIQDQAVGDAINEFIRANPEALGVKSTIWRDQWKDFKGNQSTVGGHQDHVHVEVDGRILGYQPSAADLNTAGYAPGIGTPGYDEDGNPGTYEVDPKDVREAQQRIDDQFERVREADENARQAQAAISELEADADQAEIDAAIERKRKADYDAGVARRELEDLKGELGEAQQGKFSPAKESPKSSSGGSGGSGLSLPSSFSDIGSAIGEFAGGQLGSALDVFGVGDSPGWLKGITTFLGGIGVSDAAGNSLFDGGNLFGGDPRSAPNTGLETQHGRRGGQQPGPGVVYNIQARDTEDAFVRAQRVEKERAAAKLARF